MIFSGSVPEIYDRHLSRCVFDPFAKKITRGLPECAAALEIACGTGVCTRRLANVMQGGTTIVASDRSATMVSLAARKLFATGSISWVRAAAEDLPFDEGSFELAICGFGVMFFDDKLAALKEIHRVLQPGGLFRYTVWAPMAQNPWIEVVRAVCSAAFPDCDPTWYDAPFQFADLNSNFEVMDEAGFPEVRLTPIRLPLREADPHSLARGFIQGNPAIRGLIVERGVSVRELESTLAGAFVTEFGSPARTTMRAFLFEAGVID
jgi:SAM-dependent methyltransferase